MWSPINETFKYVVTYTLIMHIEKRIEKGKVKYYLSHSYREGKKVHKFRKYLGQDLSTQVLREREKIAEKLILEEIHTYTIIQDPLQFNLSAEDLAFVRSIQKEIPFTVLHLSEADWKLFSKLFTYNTNAIEGSKLSQKEVQDLLTYDKWPDKSKEDIAEAFGVDEAIRFIRTTTEPLSVMLILQLHKIVFKNSKSFAGKFRKKGEEVVVMDNFGRVVHEGAPQARIRPLLFELVMWYEAHVQQYPGLILAAVMHNQFENIHPFADGNGRVGRILLNFILLRHHLPPLNIDFKNRMEYYLTLQKYEQGKDLKPTIELYIKEYKDLAKRLGKR